MKTVELSKFSDYCEAARTAANGAVYPLSVVQKYQSGRIFELSRCVLIWHLCGFGFVLSEPCESDCTEIIELMKSARSEGRRLVYFCESDEALEHFEESSDVVIQRRYFYEFSLDAAKSCELPEGFELRELDGELLARLDGRITPAFSWESAEQFLQRGKGFCVTCGEKVAAWAFSAAVSDDEIDIGVETAEEFRGNGLAVCAAAEMIRYVLQAGKKPVWACHSGNTASQRVAVKLGFEKISECAAVQLA